MYRLVLDRPVALLFVALLGWAACGGSEAKDLFRVGEESWHRGDYPKAIASFGKLVDVYPEDPLAEDALMRLGDINYLFLNRFDDAIMFYQDLIKKTGDRGKRVDARMKIATIYRGKKNDCRMAVVEYQEVLSDNPPDEIGAEAQYRTAMCHYQNGDFPQARTEFDILISTYPGSEYADDALAGVGHSLYALRRYRQAIKIYEKVVETSRDRDLVTDARFGIASCREEAGLLAEALAEYKAILEEHPNRAMVEDRVRNLEERIAKGVKR
jgi:TolA-binding protein